MMHRICSFVAARFRGVRGARRPSRRAQRAGAGPRVAGLPDFTELYDKQGPAVVSIDVTQKVAARARLPSCPRTIRSTNSSAASAGPAAARHARARIRRSSRSAPASSSASDGYILTNAHVVDGADEITVKLTDKREFKAKVIGADKRTDIALLKIDAKDLPEVTIGDPDKLKVGEWVVAIGKPFGFENTMTAGIVSAKGRDLPQENFVPFIQTDVAINPGNSGGPLFNMRGEVVGINSLIFSRTGGFMGLSFAIPIDVAMNTVAQLKEKGRVTRGRIGVQIQEVTKEIAESFGLSKPAGALVNSVEKGGPADKAGVEAGDIILKADGREVRTSSELPRIVTVIKPGHKVTLTVWRKGAQKDLAVTVAEIKEDAPATPRVARRPGAQGEGQAEPAGSRAADLTDEQNKELDGKTGVLIEDVAGTVRGNVQPGDIILAIVSRGADHRGEERRAGQRPCFPKLERAPR